MLLTTIATTSDALASFFSPAYKENITFLLALLGSIGTFISSAHIYLSNRRKVTIKIFDYTSYHGEIAQFLIHIQNDSSSPLCISSISLVCDGIETCCELIPKKIRGTGGDLLKTPMFPINLSGKQGVPHFLEFVGLEQIQLVPDKKIDFVIYTNRGSINKSVILPPESRYLHIGK